MADTRVVPLAAPHTPAALAALPSNRELAIYDAEKRTVHTYARSGAQLVETYDLTMRKPDKVNEREDAAPNPQNPFFEWLMAANAPVVVGVDQESGIWVIRPQSPAKRFWKDVKVTHLVAVDRLGTWCLVQRRFELALLNLHSEAIMPVSFRATTGDVHTTDSGLRYLAAITGDAGKRISVQRLRGEVNDSVSARLVAPAGAGTPLYVRFSGDPETECLYVVYGAVHEGESRQRITLQRWQVVWGEKPTLNATKALHFSEPFANFTTLPGTGRMACDWPRRGGYVLEKTENDVPFTSKIRPVGTREVTLWVPHDTPKTIHASLVSI